MINRQTIILLKVSAFLLLLLPLSSFAEVVKYTDDNNNTHFVDSVDKVPEQFRSQVEKLSAPKVSKIPSPTYESLPPKAYYEQTRSRSSRKGSVRGSRELEIFVASWCSFCRALEKDLTAKKISYIRRDIENDPSAEADYTALGRGGIPISRIGSTIIRGYKPDEIIATLKKR